MVPYLVDLGQGGPHSSYRQPAPAAVLKQPPRGPLPPRAEHPARGLLPLQGAAGGLVPAQLRPPLAVAVRCAWLSRVAGPFRGRRAGGHTLGDVLVVRWWASLVGAAGNRRGRWAAEQAQPHRGHFPPHLSNPPTPVLPLVITKRPHLEVRLFVCFPMAVSTGKASKDDTRRKSGSPVSVQAHTLSTHCVLGPVLSSLRALIH